MPTGTEFRAPSENLPGDGGSLSRLTRRSAAAASRRPRTVIALWVLFVAGLVLAGSMTGTRMLGDNDGLVGDSAEANSRLQQAGLSDPAVENLMIVTGDAASTRSATADLVGQLRLESDVKSVADPFESSAGLAAGGRKALVQATLRGSPENAIDRIGAVEDSIALVEKQNPGTTVYAIGPGTIDRAVSEVFEKDLRTAEMFSLPLTLIILLIAFGALVAASVPLLLGVTSVVAAIGGMGLISQLYPASEAGVSLVVLLGLAVGVDYSLFYIRREREERRAGRGPDAALNATSATVGRAIVISGITVIIGLAGLLVTGLPVFISMALATMLVVAIAMVGSLTVLPAVLALLGDRINRGRIPGIDRLKRRLSGSAGSGGKGDGDPATAGTTGFWPWLAATVTRRPALSGAIVGCVLVAIALPAIDMTTGESETGLPADTPIMVAHSAIEAAFPGAPATSDLVVTGRSLDSADSRQALERIGATAVTVTGGTGRPEVVVSDDGRTARVRVASPELGPKLDRELVADLRERLPAAVEESLPGSTLLVTGATAETADFTERLDRTTPIVVGMVLLLAMLLLLATFRSLPLALSVVGLNLLSIAATCGIVTLVFQNTWAEGLLDFTSSGTVTTWVPLNAFVILFGLSMDYTILVLERIREGRGNGLSPREAAQQGVGATAGAVTSAAAVMIAVFAIFPTLPMVEMKMLGVALSVGILIDATLVRGVALPAMVALLGERGVRAPEESSIRRRIRSLPGHATGTQVAPLATRSDDAG